MISTEYLKNSYKLHLRTFAVFNVAVFWSVVISGADFSALATLLSSISIEHGVIGLFAPIGTFLLDGQLSAGAKAHLVFWRYKHPLPGSRAFSEHLQKESRADPALLAEQWGPFPTEPTHQNRLWYRIYQSIDQEIRVREAHRAWLFSRDMAAYAVLFLFIFGIATFISNVKGTVTAWYLSALALQWLTTTLAARNYAVRFVRTVLAIASHMKTLAKTGNGTRKHKENA